MALNNNNNNNTTIPEGTKPDPSDDDLKLLAALEEANRSVLEALVTGPEGRVSQGCTLRRGGKGGGEVEGQGYENKRKGKRVGKE